MINQTKNLINVFITHTVTEKNKVNLQLTVISLLRLTFQIQISLFYRKCLKWLLLPRDMSIRIHILAS